MCSLLPGSSTCFLLPGRRLCRIVPAAALHPTQRQGARRLSYGQGQVRPYHKTEIAHRYTSIPECISPSVLAAAHCPSGLKVIWLYI